MAQSSFFGLTSYGPGTTYDKSSAKPLHFHEVPDDVFVDLFRKHALGESQLATILQVAGSTTMLTKDVLGLFQEALGRKASVAEVNAVQTYFDTETSATISLPTFCKSLAEVKNISCAPQSSCSSTSYSKYDDDKTRHHRVGYEPQSSFNCPVTTQQVCNPCSVTADMTNPDKLAKSASEAAKGREKVNIADLGMQAIGWHTHKVLANDQDPRFPLSQTDVTRKEGRSVADYFGFLA